MRRPVSSFRSLLECAVRHPEFDISSEHYAEARIGHHLPAHSPREVATCWVGAEILVSEFGVVLEVYYYRAPDMFRSATAKVPWCHGQAAAKGCRSVVSCFTRPARSLNPATASCDAGPSWMASGLADRLPGRPEYESTGQPRRTRTGDRESRRGCSGIWS